MELRVDSVESNEFPLTVFEVTTPKKIINQYTGWLIDLIGILGSLFHGLLFIIMIYNPYITA